MRKKKILTFFLAICMVTTFTACGNQADKDKAEKKEDKKVEYKMATVENLETALKDDNAVVVDARPEAAYMGWELKNDGKGGHIKGATDFPIDMLTCTFNDKENVDKMTRDEHLEYSMKNKGIKKDTEVIVYDGNGRDAQEVAEYFTQKGIKKVKLFDMNKWEKSLKSYPDYQLYIPAEKVKDLIDGKKVEKVGDVKDLRIVDVCWGDNKASGFNDGHIPGSTHINSDEFDVEDNQYVLEDDKTLINLAKKNGIDLDSTVICTGDSIYSCRYATILRYLGVKNVYVMSGGASAWKDAGYEMEKEVKKPRAVKNFGTDKPLNPDVIDTVEEAAASKDRDDFTLVDTRTKEEYAGEISGYDYLKEKGRIPGTVLSCSGFNTSSSMIKYQNVDSTMRNAEEIENMWKKEGLDSSKHLSFFCGNGYRAAVIYWDTLVLGYDNTSLYADGWIGWNHNKLPVEKGDK